MTAIVNETITAAGQVREPYLQIEQWLKQRGRAIKAFLHRLYHRQEILRG